MIKFDVTNRFSAAVQFTAEIDCAEDAPRSVRLGLAVRWAIKMKANLSGANLYRADLCGADLSRADLSGVNLSGADLYGADLYGADLYGAKWRDGIVINKAPIQINGLTYPVTILDEHMQIGCELHRPDEWGAFDDTRIAQMDNERHPT